MARNKPTSHLLAFACVTFLCFPHAHVYKALMPGPKMTKTLAR